MFHYHSLIKTLEIVQFVNFEMHSAKVKFNVGIWSRPLAESSNVSVEFFKFSVKLFWH